MHIIGVSEAKPLSSGWCETGSHGTLKLDGTSKLDSTLVGTTLLGVKCRLHSCTPFLHLQTLSQPTAVWFTYVGITWTANQSNESQHAPEVSTDTYNIGCHSHVTSSCILSRAFIAIQLTAFVVHYKHSS